MSTDQTFTNLPIEEAENEPQLPLHEEEDVQSPTTTQEDFTTGDVQSPTTTQEDFTPEDVQSPTTTQEDFTPEDVQSHPQDDEVPPPPSSDSEDSDDYLNTMYLVSIDGEPKFVFESLKTARKFIEIKALDIADYCSSQDPSIQSVFVSEDDDVDSEENTICRYTVSAYYKFMVVQYETKLHYLRLSTVETVIV